MATLLDAASAQRFLQTHGFASIEADNDWGQLSRAAAAAWAQGHAIGYGHTWSPERIRIAVEQGLLKSLGFYTASLDGIPGPASQAAVVKWHDYITFVRPSPAPEAHVPTSTVWPRQSECLRFYGTPGQASTGWDIVSVALPYERCLAWAPETKVNKAQIHAKCKEAYLAVHEEILAHYGLASIRDLHIDHWGGTVAVRRMRNGSSWSMHAFGCAEDLDPSRNQLHETSTTARFARPDYAPMIDIWEKYGAISLGRARNFDWMHFQFARL